ncbi:SOP1 [Scenedesmus sp. PABB004]|nr:SOP1 [Scenedesmus sp. PABB004]
MASVDGLATAIDSAPVTVARPLPLGLDASLPQPGVARAAKAVSKECPQGAPDSLSRPDHTVLHQHCDFFDRFSYPSAPTWLPDPFMRIYLKNVHRCKHGSDSEVYDTEGRFVPQRFEELFSKYDRGNKGGLSWDDLQARARGLTGARRAMILGNMNIMDPVGWIAERLEWWTLYLLAADDAGVISKEAIRANYDGSLWFKVAAEVEAKAAARAAANKAKWQ